MNHRPALLAGIAISCAFALAACGGGGDSDVDANTSPDASHQPDAPVVSCQPPNMMCGTECIDTSSDPMNCNGCGNACQTGASCVSSSCMCPPNFLPSPLPEGIQEMVRGDILPGAYVAIDAFIVSEIDLAVVAFAQTGTRLNFNYVLSADNLGTPPFFAAGYNIDTMTMMPQAAFYATAGTLRFTSRCDVGVSGILRNATFQAVTDLMNPTIDPNGCSFDAAEVRFSIGDPCP